MWKREREGGEGMKRYEREDSSLNTPDGREVREFEPRWIDEGTIKEKMEYEQRSKE